MNEKGAAEIVELANLRVACRHCSLFQLCLPIGLGDADLDRLEKIIKRKRLAGRGDYLFRRGDAFRSIFAVKSGSVKTVTVAEDGREQVTGFHLPGELFGLDAINSGIHCCSARALERTTVCEIPFDRFESFGSDTPIVLRQMLRIMSKEILRDRTLTHLTKKHAEERLAGFLLGLSDRYTERGFSGSQFRLSMSRNEIGNYLGLAVETVSRLFTRFQQDGLITVRAKDIRLLDLDRLRAVAGGPLCENPGRGA